MDMEEILKNGLAALFPVYKEGNVTMIFTGDGEQLLVRRTCKTVLKNLARFYGIDLTAVREHYGSFINKKQGVPIPMAVNLLLIPVKVRKSPLGENDGTFGYVNFREIKQVADAADGKCSITFRCDKSLLVLVSQSTMREYMKNAQLAENIFLNQHFHGYDEAVGRSWENLQESDSKYSARVLPFKKAPTNGQKAQLFPLENSLEHNEVLLREYLLKLLMEIIDLQRNQALK
ncbi:MAG: hypothetical protein GXW90_05240 [Tepidanaerobacter acetatoxydans]|uniref:competence protein ComK n=1 Tax=Tepidanaerobacter acetatoxydans TaxID=499229 RepID=UPI0026F2BB4F|nr:hypothetical protein [Tepidanaerobacter acetatoxydans]NLU10337.1 hypothetical protein [Tepidanaerobacter acetatoxydans]